MTWATTYINFHHHTHFYSIHTKISNIELGHENFCDPLSSVLIPSLVKVEIYYKAKRISFIVVVNKDLRFTEEL